MNLPWNEILPFPPFDTPVLVTVARGGLAGETQVVISEYRGTSQLNGELVERWAGIPSEDLVLAWILPESLTPFTYD